MYTYTNMNIYNVYIYKHERTNMDIYNVYLYKHEHTNMNIYNVYLYKHEYIQCIPIQTWIYTMYTYTNMNIQT